MTEIWVNPVCSKCATALQVLNHAEVEVEQRHYLEQAPTADELHDVLQRLRLEPWDLTRLTEPTAVELGMAEWPPDRDRWIAALANHPVLIQRPILLLDDGTAVLARTEQTLRDAISAHHGTTRATGDGQRQYRDTSPDAASDRLDTSEFDAFVEGLDYPMFIVTAASDGQRAGCLVGFSSQVSIDPPRMLICLSVQNHTYRVARRADMLAVHVLGPGQRDLAELFGGVSGDDVDKFARCSWRLGPGDVPLLEDCPRRIVGRVLRQDPFGDHVAFLLDPTDIEVTSTGAGLSYEEVEDLEAGHPA